MSPKKSVIQLDEIPEAKNVYRFRRAANINSDNDPASTSFVSYLAEGYALYAAAMFPPLLHTMPHGSQVNSSDRDERSQNTADDPVDNASDKVSTMATSTGQVLADSTHQSWLRSAVNLIAAPWRYFRREHEISRMINLLSSMDDRSLRDIGVHRSQITYVVRHGRED